MAFASPELEVLGITCVAGNVPLALTTRNARIVCELAGRRDVPVFAGCDAPLQRKLVTAENIHGKSGLDGIDLPEPSMALQDGRCGRFPDRDAAPRTGRHRDAGADRAADQHRGRDAARARIVDRVQQIVLMGGGYFEGGNITPAAEFNIFVDPEAAQTRLCVGRGPGRVLRWMSPIAR